VRGPEKTSAVLKKTVCRARVEPYREKAVAVGCDVGCALAIRGTRQRAQWNDAMFLRQRGRKRGESEKEREDYRTYAGHWSKGDT